MKVQSDTLKAIELIVLRMLQFFALSLIFSKCVAEPSNVKTFGDAATPRNAGVFVLAQSSPAVHENEYRENAKRDRSHAHGEDGEDNNALLGSCESLATENSKKVTELLADAQGNFPVGA